MKYVLLYELADGGLARAPQLFPGHRARNLQFHAQGTLLMTGPFTNPAEGAMAIFTSREAAEEFARGDPFVLDGVVGRWHIREWKEGLAPLAGSAGKDQIP
jgi:uncharacterized protein YciI